MIDTFDYHFVSYTYATPTFIPAAQIILKSHF